MDVAQIAVALRYHNWRYFTLADPAISDQAFDDMARRLALLHPGHAALEELTPVAEDARTKVVHREPMLSLDKCYDFDEFRDWVLPPNRGKERVRAFDGGFIETPKIDGVAASFRYNAAGRLIQATTRGDGRVGESFLANARYIDEVPNQLSGPALGGEVEVRGELYLRWSVFKGLPGHFANPRNTTAGAIKQKRAARTGSYGLSFFVYDVLGPTFASEMEKVAWTNAHGLQAVETRLLTRTGDVATSFAHWNSRRHDLDFETDGVVYKVNQVTEQARMGFTAHHPRFAVAYKFRGDEGVTTLLDVEWSVSRSGAITPVAIIEGIELSGAIVTRCSLHNLKQMAKLDLAIGAQVTAMRRGGVIPHIENRVSPGSTPIVIPAECPACAGPTVQQDDVLRCAKPGACSAAGAGSLEYFAKGVGMDGFGPKIVRRLFELGTLRTPADYYRLTRDALIQVDLLGDKLAARLLKNVASARSIPLADFLKALGVEDLGDVAAKLFAQHFKTLAAVQEATEADVLAVRGFGSTTALGIVTKLGLVRPVIDELAALVTVEPFPEEEPPHQEGHAMGGKSAVFTGTLVRMGRKEVQAQLRALGGVTPSGVSNSLDFLVIGDHESPLNGEGRVSSKHKKAMSLNAAGASIDIVAERTFFDLMEGVSLPAEGAAAEEEPPSGQGTLF